MRTQNPHGEVRIIAGQFKGRRLRFPAVSGLRPSGDRIRETVFSWLIPWLPNARVLDVFSGSGALAFEAASRGARQVICNDANAHVVAALHEHKAALSATMVEVCHDDAVRLLQSLTPGFDIIFLDPPFRAQWLEKLIPIIIERQLLCHDGVLYIESETELGDPLLPANWEWFRAKHSGQVRYGLARIAASE